MNLKPTMRGYDNNTMQDLAICYASIFNFSDTSDLDLLNQPFALQDVDGSLWWGNTSDISDLVGTAVTSAAIFAAQLGASMAVLIVMLLLTTREKRKSLVFIFNMLALVFDIIRCALQLAQLNSMLMNFVVIELSLIDAPGIEQTKPLSIAGTLFTGFLTFCIEIALVIQVRVVCAAASRLQRNMITVLIACIALLAISFRINLMVVNIISTLNLSTTYDSQARISQGQDMANISVIISICVFSAIFTFKLARAIRSRRALGLKQFGPMQIIFIMGCQTLFLPAIFAILADFVLKHSQLQSVVETLVTIFLPLSSIWASANAYGKLAANNHVAVLALPEYKAQKDDSTSANTITLVDHSNESAGDRADGLNAYSRQFKSNATTQDIEMQRPVRKTSFS